MQPMAKSNPCKLCGKPASVHVTQIIGNQVAKVDVCQVCAQKQGMIDPTSFSLAAALGKQLLVEGLKMVMGQVACSACGCTIEQFKKGGRLGCPACYAAFQPVLEAIVKDSHGNQSQHKGKVATRAMAHSTFTKQLTTLEVELKEAIAEERFEDAARMRDEIQAVKATLESSCTVA